MIFVSYTKTDTYYEFVGENGEKQIYPVSSIILTDDESGFIAVKNTASRQTIGLYRKPKPKEKIVLFEGSESFAQWWDAARFSKTEGFLQVKFEHDANDYLNYLYINNEPLYVEFSSVPDSGTLRLQNAWWSTIFDAAAEVSTSEPLQIYITDNAMYTDIYNHDLALVDITGDGFTITNVYFYK